MSIPPFVLSVRKTTQRLYLVLIGCFIGSLAVQGIVAMTGHRRLWGLVQLLNMDGDLGFPTWFNSFLLALAAFFSWLAARTLVEVEARRQGSWKTLALVFLLASIDEVAAVHEEIGAAIESRFHPTGYLSFGWVMVGVPLAGIVFIYFFPFLKRLPSRLSQWFILSGILYLLGAAGVEALSAGRWATVHRNEDLMYLFLAHVEELLEMTGLILFIRALMEYLRTMEHTTSIRIEP